MRSTMPAPLVFSAPLRLSLPLLRIMFRSVSAALSRSSAAAMRAPVAFVQARRFAATAAAPMSDHTAAQRGARRKRGGGATPDAARCKLSALSARRQRACGVRGDARLNHICIVHGRCAHACWLLLLQSSEGVLRCADRRQGGQEAHHHGAG